MSKTPATKGSGKFFIDRESKAWLDVLARLPKVVGTQRCGDLAAAWGPPGWLVRNAAHELTAASALKVAQEGAGKVCVVGTARRASCKEPTK